MFVRTWRAGGGGSGKLSEVVWRDVVMCEVRWEVADGSELVWRCGGCGGSEIVRRWLEVKYGRGGEE